MLQKVLSLAAAALLLMVIGSIVYDQVGKTEVRATVDLRDGEDPFSAIPALAPGVDIAKITEIDKDANRYEIVYLTHKRKLALLEWLLGRDSVEHAEVE